MNIKIQPMHKGLRLAAAALTLLLMTAGCSSNNAPTLAATQVALTSSVATANVGTAITVTATLSGASSPIGAIDFYDGSTFLQAGILSGTTVTASLPSLAPGAHSITAVYGGDQANNSSRSAAVNVNITVPTAITVSASPAVAATGSSVTLTAMLTSSSFVTTGTVTFLSGATVLGTAPVLAPMTGGGGSATLTTTALPVGNDSVTASLAANGAFLASSSPTITVQIYAGRAPTSLNLVTSPAGTTTAGTQTTLTATLVPASGTATASGTVQFMDGASPLGSPVTLASNVATLTTKQFNVGNNALTAVYSGDLNYLPSTSSSVGVTVTPYTGATYTNPLNLNDPVTGKVYNCPDPAIIKSQNGTVDTWYVYCTGDAFNAADMVGGNFKAHLISIFSSQDLVNWTYVRDAFASTPTWVQAGQELQTPAIKFFGGLYHLYYEAPATAAAPNGSAIGVGTATTAAGPFTDSGTPVIGQTRACGGGCNRTTFAPEVIADGTGQLWMTYGGVYAGLSIRKLSADGLTSDATSEINIGVDNYYQDPFIWSHGGFFYEFVTAGGCCSGVYSTYNVHVGRSATITGPYLDAEGNDLNAFSTPATLGSPGGDPVLVMNGNDIVGAGSNSIFTDESGQDYILYSGVSRKQPYLPTVTGYTGRQLMMDAIDWVNGWPRARNGAGPSDFATPQPVPAAQPGATNGYVSPTFTPDSPGTAIAASSDDFNSSTLSSQWTFLHATPSYSLTGSAYSVQSVNQESVVPSSMPNLPILTEPEPAGNYLLEVKFTFSIGQGGPSNYIFAYPQAGVFVYSTDTNYLRLDEVPVFETRQIEYLNEVNSSTFNFAPVGTPNPGASTWLRIAKRVGTGGAPDTYTSYSSTDGITFLRGPAWTAMYGAGTKLGLFSGNTSGYTAAFDYIHVTTLLP